jgi:hypothetical protein
MVPKEANLNCAHIMFQIEVRRIKGHPQPDFLSLLCQTSAYLGLSKMLNVLLFNHMELPS